MVEGGYTLNEPKRYDIATVRSPERKEASGIGDDREKKDTHQIHPQAQYRHGSASLNEAAESGGDRSQMAYFEV